MQPFVVSIQKILKKKLNIASESLGPKTDLQKDLNMVDWELQYLFNAIEKKWQVSFQQAETENLRNIEQLRELITKQTKRNLN
ncbi:MAG: hypothetical protein RLZZ28_2359 [Bacteroidota bacterium]|jgi:acyl carrier protein